MNSSILSCGLSLLCFIVFWILIAIDGNSEIRKVALGKKPRSLENIWGQAFGVAVLLYIALRMAANILWKI